MDLSLFICTYLWDPQGNCFREKGLLVKESKELCGNLCQLSAPKFSFLILKMG